ncbi:cytochrome P450 [Kitasatospora sp. MAP12-15]|uniref:cytochrome P450 n=1 Tax=unclassified Kitasatospora TaxID=2633591 RepID=UPI002476B4FE|nr:cytochrome P450 [Kitasatospora sp. MAP12-44]MDH6114908.1 cytochrome P450 [Kitasatospora sp. MAP12-44]
MASTTTREFSTGTAPGRLPLLGHAVPLRRRPLEFLAELPARGDVVTVHFGRSPAHLVCHPELVRQVLQDPQTFDKGGPLFDKVRLLIGNGLVTCPRSEHRAQRRLVQPAFQPSRIRTYAQAAAAEADRVTADWQQGVPVDIGARMQILTARVTARTLFATDIDERAMDELANSLAVVLDGLYRRMVLPLGPLDRLPTRGNRRFQQALTGLGELIDAIIEAHRGDPTDRGDLLSALLAARDEETGAGLTGHQIHDQVMTVLSAGTETTANTLGWAFHLLGTHPEAERALHAELDDVLGGRPPRVEDLPALEYARRVLTETLRLRPPAWLLTRVTTVDTELAGRRLRAGSTVAFSPYALHHDPALFTAPEAFDPDRWLPERLGEIPRGAMVPFGGGARKCVGDSFALTEATLALTRIAARWRLRPVPGPAVRAVPKMTLGTGPLPMLPEPR